MGNRSATGEQPFKNGLRQKLHICTEPGDEVGEHISNVESILGIGTDFA
jgi:hypothetical protein